MYEELITTLREYAEWADANIYEVPITLPDALKKAADAIEELQQIAAHYEQTAKDYWKEACDYKAMIPRWISVTEEPPLKVGDDGYNGYLVYADGYYEVADYTTDKFVCVPYFYVNEEYEQGVTHWMPLPKPPKEVEE